MNYMYLMKKIAECITGDKKDIDRIKKIVADKEFNDTEYEKQIKKYLDGKSKDLYC